MSTLLYRGHIYEHQPAAQSLQTASTEAKYNTCTEHQPVDLHPHLSYRGIATTNPLRQRRSADSETIASPTFLWPGESRAQFNLQMNHERSSSGKKLLIGA